MNIYQAIIIAAAATVVLTGCRSRQAAAETPDSYRVAPQLIGGTPSKFLPMAHIYKTNGDFRDNVPIQLTSDGKQIASFPAPSDLSQRSTPVVLSDGWLLDRRGVGENTVFTRYTYSEYMKLGQAPSTSELMEAVIPGSKVTEMVELPIGMSEAISKPSLCEPFIKNDFKGCTIILK